MPENIFNIPASCRFIDILAQKILDDYSDNRLAMTDITVLLPTRRACRQLRNAFVRLQGMSPTLLPRMMPLGDTEEDEIFFSETALELQSLPPAIDPVERTLLFIRLITARNREFDIENISFAQACFLAQELGRTVDMVNHQQLDFGRLENLVPEEYADHWQKTLKFLRIITAFLPQILEERGLIDASERSRRLLQLQSRFWQNEPPLRKIIIAGTTATFPAMKELVKTVLALPHGEIYLAGIDKYLDNASWDQINESHPQFELKQLLDYLEISRFEVPDLMAPPNPAREKFISEVMRPAVTSDCWRQLNKTVIPDSSVTGLKVVDCREISEEALAIALIMRQTLEIPEKTAALVTTDRNLARRVAAQLQRWDIKVDDSAGRPLSLTPVGIFLRLIAEACEEGAGNIPLMSLSKHPFTVAGMERTTLLNLMREYEKKVLRNHAPNTALSQRLTPFFEMLHPLSRLLQQESADFKQLLTCHLRLAETLAADTEKSGAEKLWRGDDGEAAATLFGKLLHHADTLGAIPQHQYVDLLNALFNNTPVRPKYGTHPRLQILGPIESRLVGFDTVIIGGVNEGSFPTVADNGAWMSRPMKKEFGFPLPEKSIGILAHDFASMLAQSEVYLTRSDRVEGTPTVKSRWLMRMETVLNAAGVNPILWQAENFAYWSSRLDRSQNHHPIAPPRPCPPLKARPRELWAGAVENLMRDPYIIFARYILRLQPLDELQQQPDFSDFGNLMHAALEKFNRRFPAQLPADAENILLRLIQNEIDARQIGKEIVAFWYPAAVKMVKWLLAEEQNYRPGILKTNSEVSGRFSFDAPGGKFTIGAKADRVDQTADGGINIIDYKTGSARSKKEIKAGYAPQLPIEGIIAEMGGFEGIPAAEVRNLIYWRLGKESITVGEDVKNVLQNNLHNIKQLISAFDDEKRPYITQPNSKYAPAYSDYEHLSRIKEWGITEKNDD